MASSLFSLVVIFRVEEKLNHAVKKEDYRQGENNADNRIYYYLVYSGDQTTNRLAGSGMGDVYEIHPVRDRKRR